MEKPSENRIEEEAVQGDNQEQEVEQKEGGEEISHSEEAEEKAEVTGQSSEEREEEGGDSPKEHHEEAEEEREEGEKGDEAYSAPKDAKGLIEEARALVEESDKEIKSCMEVLDEDIEDYEETKSKLLESSVDESRSLLEELGFEPEAIEDNGEEGLDFEPEEAVAPMQVQNLSSGKFGAFILALVAGLAAVAGWFYVASEQLGMTIDVTKVPNGSVLNRVFTWIGGGMTGGEGNPLIGLAIVFLSVLIVMIIVYKLKVYMRAQSNLHTAEKIKEEAKFYCSKKEECKKEMEKVSEHIHEVIKVLHTFKVFIDEQNAKMRRILYLEGELPFDEYHLKSKEEIKHTNLLLNSLNELISTPMANERGSVSDEAKAELKKTERVLERFEERLYE